METLGLLSGIGHLPVDVAQSAKAMGLLPEGTYNNRIAYQDRVHDDTSCPETHVDIAFDAQTSGGLLLAVNSAKAETVADAIRELGFRNAAIIGRVEEGKGTIHLVD